MKKEETKKVNSKAKNIEKEKKETIKKEKKAEVKVEAKAENKDNKVATKKLPKEEKKEVVKEEKPKAEKKEVAKAEIKEEKIVEEKKEEVKHSRKGRRLLVILVSLIVAVVLFIYGRGEYLEINEIGEQYTSIFFTNLKYYSIVAIVNFLIVFSVFYFTTKNAKKGMKEFFISENKKMPRLPQKSFSFIIAIITTIVTSGFITKQLMLCISNTQFVNYDPVFNLDIGFYVFILPFVDFMLKYLAVILVASLLYWAFYYIISINIYFDGIDREVAKKSKILDYGLGKIKMVVVLLALILLVNTANVGVQKFINLNSKSEQEIFSLFGAGEAEKTIKLFGYAILSILILISGLKTISHVKKSEGRKAVKSILIVPVYLIVLLISQVCFDIFYINKNELERESANIAQNIKYTEHAYGIDVDIVPINGSDAITENEIRDNIETINNTTIVTENVLKDALKSSDLTYKGIYRYTGTNPQVYNLDGSSSVMYISARETENPTGTYNNKNYDFTHGYGILGTYASKVSEAGTTLNIGASFEDKSTELTGSRVYFGLNTNNIIVTNTNNKKEFDYPTDDGEDNTEFDYDGKAGISANVIDRVVLAVKNGDLKLLASNITENSKILTNRNVVDRAKKLLPDLTYDEEPYIVVRNNGDLVWVIDAYTTSNNYPYSQRTRIDTNGLFFNTEINYIKNSVKVLVDAYDGTVNFYLTDNTDPIAMAYKKLYPDLFAKDNIPTDVAEKLLYPRYLYNIQAETIARYHGVQGDVLYRQQDVWNIASHNSNLASSEKGEKIKPYYTMVKTIDDSTNKLALVLPYTLEGKQSINAYLIGTVDKNGKNVLKIYKFDSTNSVLGPMQLDSELEQDKTLFSQIEALNVTGTRITKELRMVPINNKILYIEPIYQEYVNETDSTPVLKKVVVASANKLAIGNTLAEALQNLTSKAIDIDVTDPNDIDKIIDEIIEANKNLSTSTESNDWEQIGRDTKKLQELIKTLEKAKREADKEKKSVPKEEENREIPSIDIPITVGN